ncbi:MAG TPA: VTT domain-containing protein [Bacilli bacterium]|nr:VTT domain-containing protein [Bacilli bacterium]
MGVIVLESIIPMLPLGLFIALNMLLFGNITGFIISWVATSLGCLLSFMLVRKFLFKVKETKENKTIKNIIKKINKISLSKFVVITALPFTPAFAINIASGISKMNIKKFMVGILISKIFVVYFWGFIGTTFLESITDFYVIIKLAVMLAIAYILSKLVMKKFNLE